MDGGGECSAAGWCAEGGVTRRRAAAPRSPRRLGRQPLRLSLGVVGA